MGLLLERFENPRAYAPRLQRFRWTVTVIRQFPFSTNSNGTPSWIDGFVIPKGKLAEKRAAIVAFLSFVKSEEVYMPFAEPAKYLAPSYLLPAISARYNPDSKLVQNGSSPNLVGGDWQQI